MKGNLKDLHARLRQRSAAKHSIVAGDAGVVPIQITHGFNEGGCYLIFNQPVQHVGMTIEQYDATIAEMQKVRSFYVADLAKRSS